MILGLDGQEVSPFLALPYSSTDPQSPKPAAQPAQVVQEAEHLLQLSASFMAAPDNSHSRLQIEMDDFISNKQ